MSRYTPTITPDTNQAVRAEFERIAQAMATPNDMLLLDTLYVAPNKPREGMIVLADGTSWNPGSGSGFYGYRAGAWRLLG